MTTSIDPNWPRLIQKAINKHFASALAPIRVFVDGEDRETEDLTEWFELRVVGPRFFEQHDRHWRGNVTIDLAMMHVQTSNVYNASILHGKGQAAFPYQIKVLDDADVFVANLINNPENENDINLTKFGVINKQLRLNQSTLESDYRIYLERT